MLKKLRMWFWTKRKTVNEMIKISKAIDMHSAKLAERLESLDQSKTYICPMPGASDEDIKIAKGAFEEAARQMRWTIPKIIFLNTQLTEKKKKKGSK